MKSLFESGFHDPAHFEHRERSATQRLREQKQWQRIGEALGWAATPGVEFVPEKPQPAPVEG